MALCVYKRIRSEPIRLNLNGQIVIVKGGQLVIADNSQMMGVPGFAFIRIHNQRDQFVSANSNLVINKPNPIIETSVPDPMSIEVHTLTNDSSNQIVEVTPSIPVPPKPQIIVQEEINREERKPEFKKDIIEKLKSYDNKQWFALKKEDIIKFLEDANIDYKHISSDKWELLKFLKTIIKEL
jgi:hypothetical protein